MPRKHLSMYHYPDTLTKLPKFLSLLRQFEPSIDDQLLTEFYVSLGDFSYQMNGESTLRKNKCQF